MRIIAFPASGIAYNDALYAAIEKKGIAVIDGHWAGRWLVAHVQAGDVVHIHWPSFLYESQGSAVKILGSLLRFLLLIAIVRFRANSIWWIAHNLMPHDRCRLPWVDVIARAVVIQCVSRVLVHGPEACNLLRAKFPAVRNKCVLIPHGNWIGFYPQSESKEEARRSLGLSGSGFVFLFFGQCKPYKNLEGLIDAFGKVAYQDDTLLIVGSFADEAYLQSIQRKIAGDGRIKLTPGYVADAYVARYLLACDAMCMPYNEILTSGTTMLAMSFGRPVLSIDRGFLRDVMTPDCGLLIEPNNAEALEKGLTDLRDRKWKESEILMIAEKFTYAEAARICIAELADLGMHL